MFLPLRGESVRTLTQDFLYVRPAQRLSPTLVLHSVRCTLLFEIHIDPGFVWYTQRFVIRNSHRPWFCMVYATFYHLETTQIKVFFCIRSNLSLQIHTDHCFVWCAQRFVGRCSIRVAGATFWHGL